MHALLRLSKNSKYISKDGGVVKKNDTKDYTSVCIIYCLLGPIYCR